MQFEDSNETICANEPSSFISNLPSDVLKIYVYQPFVRIRHIKINGLCPISILNGLYPSDSVYIFNGQILDSQKSFLSYNLVNGSKVVLLPSHVTQSNPQFLEKWLRLTGDKDNFEQRIDLNINQNSRRELAKIKDLKIQKLELKRKRFNSYVKSRTMLQTKLDNPYLSNDKGDNDEINSSCNTTLNINFKTSDSPSSKPLPVLWA